MRVKTIIGALESTQAKGKRSPQRQPQIDKTKQSQEQDNNDDPPSSTGGTTQEEEKSSHQGKLILDATVAPQANRYPTDLSLLNEAREFSEQIIDILYPKTGMKKKPRTYREKARKAYLALVKQRRPAGKVRRRGIKQQLQYLRRNLKHIERLLEY